MLVATLASSPYLKLARVQLTAEWTTQRQQLTTQLEGMQTALEVSASFYERCASYAVLRFSVFKVSARVSCSLEIDMCILCSPEADV